MDMFMFRRFAFSTILLLAYFHPIFGGKYGELLAYYRNRGHGGIAQGHGLGGVRVFQNISCSSEFSCELGKGTLNGTFVCRTNHRNATKTNHSFPVCIQTNRSIATDTCGCCGGTCPVACNQCPCSLKRNYTQALNNTHKHANSTRKAPLNGVEILIVGRAKPLCVPKDVSRLLVARNPGQVSCNTVCV